MVETLCSSSARHRAHSHADPTSQSGKACGALLSRHEPCLCSACHDLAFGMSTQLTGDNIKLLDYLEKLNVCT